MSDIVIKVEDLSKQYRLGAVGTGSLAHDINRAWHRVIGNEDPYLKIGETNDRAQKANSQYVWALKDISFSVKKGEVLAIIGRNGAGKSTLLKILSRTTTPTIGTIKIKGRVASLLEVGTGFHPELSGRENIFLNGAILGMTKREIKRKFDEIVDFAGVERFIETPVKRYSSGMYLRLAFGVAAHMEPEILIVDEVLAVGDAEFQKKCLGKMKDVSEREGRTVLFVSHNMVAVRQLCTTGLILDKGMAIFSGNVGSCVEAYSKVYVGKTDSLIEHKPYNNDLKISSYSIFNDEEMIDAGSAAIMLGSRLRIVINIEILNIIADLSVAIDLLNADGDLVAHITNEDDDFYMGRLNAGFEFTIQIVTERLLIIPGMYSMNLWIGVRHIDTLYEVKNFFNFLIEQSEITKRKRPLPVFSKIFLPTSWTLISN